ncbi:hypothetical protein [Vallitalea okinawensis]|uniref:hypothetical protein n=1 Tax=Vallitalea okinawensis TaxID=2078660 RepID=UPI000CFBEA21|nr:hypothetical protein [Vallitalea okinawensis]
MNYAIKDASDVQLLRRNADGTKTPVLFSDYANSTTLEFTSDRVFATAKGVNKVAFDNNKSGTFALEMQVFELKWLSILLGADENSGATKEIAKREVLAVADNKVTLKTAPKAGTVAVFKVDVDNRSHLEEVTPGSVTGLDLDLTAAALANDTKVVVYYLTEQANSKSFIITDSNFADNYGIYGDTMLTSEMGVDQFIQFRLPNCRPQGNFSVSFSASDVATISATFDILSDEHGDMCEFTYIQ